MVAMNGSRRSGDNERDDILSVVASGARNALSYVKEHAQVATQEATRGASEVAHALFETAQDEAERFYDRHKSGAASKVGRLGKAAKQTAHALHAVRADTAADYLEAASERVAEARDYLQEQSLAGILEDAGQVVRQNRAIAAGGLFLVGFAAARFLKASSSREVGGGERDEDADRRSRRAMSEPTARRQRQLGQ